MKDQNIKFHRVSTGGDRTGTSSKTDGRTDGYYETNRRISRL